jgi:hypothetical protein
MVYKVDAVSREATGKPWEFEFDGERYELPNDFDMRAASMLTDGDMRGALEMLLGTDQWHRLNASPKVFGIRALGELLQAWCRDIGVDLGEFTASPPSSKKTVAPSKRTSNGSTGSRSRTSSRSRSA